MKKSNRVLLCGSLVVCFSIFTFFYNQEKKVQDPLNFASKMFDSHNYPKCIGFAEQALSEEKPNPEAQSILGRCEERLGNFEAAHQAFTKVSEMDPENQESYRNRIVQSMKLFDRKRFQQDLMDWKHHFPDDTRIAQIENQFALTLEEQKKEGYGDDEARKLIKTNYLQSVMTRK